MFTRPIIKDVGGLQLEAARGMAGLVGNPAVPAAQATDSNQVIPLSAIQGGLYIRSGMTAGRTDTTPTAEAILAANPDMNVGDNFFFLVSVTVAFALTLAGGSGVTIGTKTSIPASGFGIVMVTKASATTVTVTIL